MDNFTIIDRRALEDKALSFEARGLLAYLMSKPDHWKVSVSELTKAGKIGRDKAYKLLKTLVNHGYAQRETVRSKDDGRVSSVDYIITDHPLTENQEVAKTPENSLLPDLPDTDLPDTVNRTLVSTDIKQVLISSNSGRNEFDRVWPFFPKKVGKKDAKTFWARNAKRLDPLANQIIEDLTTRAKTDDGWIRGFIPNPTTYLRGERWEDQIAKPQSRASSPASNRKARRNKLRAAAGLPEM